MSVFVCCWKHLDQGVCAYRKRRAIPGVVQGPFERGLEHPGLVEGGGGRGRGRGLGLDELWVPFQHNPVVILCFLEYIVF